MNDQILYCCSLEQLASTTSDQAERKAAQRGRSEVDIWALESFIHNAGCIAVFYNIIVQPIQLGLIWFTYIIYQLDLILRQ